MVEQIYHEVCTLISIDKPASLADYSFRKVAKMRAMLFLDMATDIAIYGLTEKPHEVLAFCKNKDFTEEEILTELTNKLLYLASQSRLEESGLHFLITKHYKECLTDLFEPAVINVLLDNLGKETQLGREDIIKLQVWKHKFQIPQLTGYMVTLPKVRSAEIKCISDIGYTDRPYIVATIETVEHADHLYIPTNIKKIYKDVTIPLKAIYVDSGEIPVPTRYLNVVTIFDNPTLRIVNGEATLITEKEEELILYAPAVAKNRETRNLSIKMLQLTNKVVPTQYKNLCVDITEHLYNRNIRRAQIKGLGIYLATVERDKVHEVQFVHNVYYTTHFQEFIINRTVREQFMEIYRTSPAFFWSEGDPELKFLLKIDEIYTPKGYTLQAFPQYAYSYKMRAISRYLMEKTCVYTKGNIIVEGKLHEFEEKDVRAFKYIVAYEDKLQLTIQL